MNALLSTSDLAPLLGVCDRTVRYMVERGSFPTGTYYRVGTSKTAKHVRFLTARLLAAGFLTEAQVSA